MSKYEVNINVSSKTSGSRGVTGTGRTRSDIRESMQQVSDTKKILSKAQRDRDPAVKITKQLNQSIQRLNKSINKLDSSVRGLANTIRSGGGGRPGSGGGGGGLPAGSGGGIGRVGGALPLVGAMVASFGYALSKVMQLGRASMAKIMEQRGTAGVAGIVRPGAMGQYRNIMNAAEMGQYIKEARMAAGTFNVGIPGERRKGEAMQEYQVRQQRDLGYKTSAIFGTGTEFAKTIGLAAVGARMRGETGINVGNKELTAIIQQTFRGRGKDTRGIATELPVLLREITSNMEEAVREGVDSSHIARDMASEMVTIARVTPGGQVRSAIQLQKSLVGIQKQAAQGQGGIGAWRMNMAAKRLLKGTGEESVTARQRLLESGMMSEAQKKALESGKNIGPEQLLYLSQALQGTQSKEVRQEFLVDTLKTFAGKGTEDERIARFNRRVQKTLGMDLTPQRTRQMYDYARAVEAKRKGVGAITVRSEAGGLVTKKVEDFIKENRTASLADAESVMSRRMKERGGEVRGVQYQMSQRESMLFTQAAGKARDSVILVEGSMLRLANQVSGPVAQAIDKFNKGIEVMTSGLEKAVTGIMNYASWYEKMTREHKKAGWTSFIKQFLF